MPLCPRITPDTVLFTLHALVNIDACRRSPLCLRISKQIGRALSLRSESPTIRPEGPSSTPLAPVCSGMLVRGMNLTHHSTRSHPTRGAHTVLMYLSDHNWQWTNDCLMAPGIYDAGGAIILP